MEKEESVNNNEENEKFLTNSAIHCLQSMGSDIAFFNFIIDISLRSDYMSYVARRALDGIDSTSAKYNDDNNVDATIESPVDLAQKNPGTVTKFVRENSQTLLEMFLSRLVDSFQKYISDIIREILIKNPKILSSSTQSIPLSEALSYNNINDLINDTIEKRVNSLSYDGFNAIREWCQKRGIIIVADDEEIERISELIATRNLIVHNRAIVDERYSNSVKIPKFKKGEIRKIEIDEFIDTISTLRDAVIRTDNFSAEKFSLAVNAVKLNEISSIK